MSNKYQLYVSTPTVFCDGYDFSTLKAALEYVRTVKGEAHFGLCHPNGQWHDWHLNDRMTKAQVKKRFLRLQAAANRAAQRSYRHSDDHSCIKFVCSCGLENAACWPKCVKCGRALQMFNTDSQRGSFWMCPKGHPQGPMEEAVTAGKSAGWRVAMKPFVAPKIPGHKHAFSNDGGCKLNKELDAVRASASYRFQKVWGEIPRKVMDKDGHVPLSWIKQWYIGTEFDCNNGCKK